MKKKEDLLHFQNARSEVTYTHIEPSFIQMSLQLSKGNISLYNLWNPLPHRVTEINNVLAAAETELGKYITITNLYTYAHFNSASDHIDHMSK